MKKSTATRLSRIRELHDLFENCRIEPLVARDAYNDGPKLDLWTGLLVSWGIADEMRHLLAERGKWDHSLKNW